MNVTVTELNEEFINFECIDYDGTVYGIHDTVDDRGMIQDTLVVKMDTLDEVEDSETFKRIINARSALPIQDIYNGNA